MKKIIIGLLLLCTSVFANEELTYDLYWQQAPVVCGAPPEVQRYISDEDFKPVHLSLGRASSLPDGEPVYLVAYYENDDQILVTVDVAGATETCILFRTFNKSEVIN
jgi:HSP20 family molecular chaperone IbpA